MVKYSNSETVEQRSNKGKWSNSQIVKRSRNGRKKGNSQIIMNGQNGEQSKQRFAMTAHKGHVLRVQQQGAAPSRQITAKYQTARQQWSNNGQIFGLRRRRRPPTARPCTGAGPGGRALEADSDAEVREGSRRAGPRGNATPLGEPTHVRSPRWSNGQIVK